MCEKENLRLRTLWPPSSTTQEVPAQHRHQLSLALHWDLLASRRYWKLYHEWSEKEKNITTHRLFFWSGPIWHQINKVQCFLFFAVTIIKPAHLWLSAKLYSTLGELYTAAYRPSGRPGIHQTESSRLTCAVHKNDYSNRTPCPFCSPEKYGSWVWWRATLCIRKRKRKRRGSVAMVCNCFFINVSVRSCPAWLIQRVHIHLLPHRQLTADVHWGHFMLTYNPSLFLAPNILGWLYFGNRSNWHNYWITAPIVPATVFASQLPQPATKTSQILPILNNHRLSLVQM